MKKLVLALLAGALMTAPVALAGHDGAAITVHRTYEFGPTGDRYAGNCMTGNEDLGTSCDPTGQTQDNSIDHGAVIVGPGDVPEGVDAAQAAIVDDVWGAGVVGGAICTDEDGDSTYCEEDEGEVNGQFCGQSDTVSFPPAPNWDGVAIWINGIIFQTLQGCDLTAAPFSTTGGVLNPNGGVFYTFE